MMDYNNLGCGIYRFVINKTYLNLLLNLEYGSSKINEMAKTSNISYFHLTNVLVELQKEGIITRTMNLNSYDVFLTPKGTKLVKKLSELKCIIEETDKDVKLKGDRK
jgi:predicted transcriptional regulator